MSENSDFLISAITERFGSVKRARGCFLYTAKNVRLTDLWQQGGRAILGWGEGGAVTVFKNVLERKILGTFDTDFSPKVQDSKSRLSKAVSELLNSDRRVSVFDFASRADFLRFLGNFGINAVFYRPWQNEISDFSKIPAVVVEPPFPFGENVFILALSPDFQSEIASNYRIPAPLCAAITRSIYDLIREIQQRAEKDWFRFDNVLAKYFERKGPYLLPKIPTEKWRDFLIHCLDCRIVLCPEIEESSIVPFGADAGNFNLLKKNPFDFGGAQNG